MDRLTKIKHGGTARILHTIDMIGHEEWFNSRAKHLKLGMSSNYCLTRKDIKLRLNADLDEAGGNVAKKFVLLSAATQVCAIVSLLGTVICFVVQFVFINNVTLSQGTPFPMFLENTCICNNQICPDVLFTFTPPDVEKYQLQRGGFDVGPDVTSLKYLTAWDFTNMHFTKNNKSSLSNYDDIDYSSFRDAEGSLSCHCSAYAGRNLPDWNISCDGDSAVGTTPTTAPTPAPTITTLAPTTNNTNNNTNRTNNRRRLSRTKHQEETNLLQCQHLLSEVGQGWKLVRSLKPNATSWHAATDDLAGTDVYGDPWTGIDGSWSIRFNGAVPNYNQFLFLVGNCQTWLITTVDSAIGMNYVNSPRSIIKSSVSPYAYSARWYNRYNVETDPVLSTTDHVADDEDNPNLVYREKDYMYFESNGSAPVQPNWAHGLYVYIRKDASIDEGTYPPDSSLYVEPKCTRVAKCQDVQCRGTLPQVSLCF